MLSHTRRNTTKSAASELIPMFHMPRRLPMRIQRSIFPSLIALCLLSGGLLVGCGGQGAVNSQPDSVAAAPILLRDASPRQLEAYIHITIGGYERATRETTNIELSFSSNGRLVQ